MALDPQAQAILDLMAAAGSPPLETRTPEEARVAASRLQALSGPPEDVAKVENRTIAGAAGEIPVRIYTPQGGGPFPALVFFHGGGWVIGDLDIVDVPCRRIANRAGCVVVSVDYRLAPEHKFPTAVEDAYAVTEWLAANGSTVAVDASRLAVGGDSAGGNLAAVVALIAKDKATFALRHQVLLYPVTNHDFGTGSYRENGDGYYLTRAAMQWFWQHYLSDTRDGRHPYASPILADDHRGLPPALVITAEYDPLRDEGEAYAQRLASAGVPVRAERYSGMIHGFCWMPGAIEQGGHALDMAAATLKEAFAN
ncbi:alpha/beta hydrolase fold domain-containing protein [Paraburkholderia diazotrophica]|uniref:Acetyl esterase n=1 Tax=Paraburkholderia diazotrophica TaxID=667676 RepID=A0A1H6QZE5_9BURK|nr:alpha/beta hydrolase fold domain-containing protein [Paraburkholderia diazotrophica]SEI48893.1 acetyl esterase [Paraburkholderia diazotrophica]